jgi:peptidoglycan LD-endopeptidase LytH
MAAHAFRGDSRHQRTAEKEHAQVLKRPGAQRFVDIPDEPSLRLAWPTPNRALQSEPDRFFARTRANPDYGRPGWTRDCGKRFHRGIDIAPVEPIPTGRTTSVMFSDCATGAEYESIEPVWMVNEDIYAVTEGIVEEVNDEPEATTLGRYALIRHRWPTSGNIFFTLYAHLASLKVMSGEEVEAGQRIGRMGQTSSSPDARNWMAIAPHLHFEALDASFENYDPEAFLRKFLR